MISDVLRVVTHTHTHTHVGGIDLRRFSFPLSEAASDQSNTRGAGSEHSQGVRHCARERSNTSHGRFTDPATTTSFSTYTSARFIRSRGAHRGVVNLCRKRLLRPGTLRNDGARARTRFPMARVHARAPGPVSANTLADARSDGPTRLLHKLVRPRGSGAHPPATVSQPRRRTLRELPRADLGREPARVPYK